MLSINPYPAQTPGYDRDEVYPPAEDTFLLLAASQAEVRPQDAVIEIGCGTALISRTLAPFVRRLLATDINPHAVRAARATGIEAIRADLFLGIKGRFDLVIFNAPYLPTRPDERTGRWIDWALDGGPSGRETVCRFLEDLAEHLLPGGRALLLVSSLTGLSEVLERAAACCLTAQMAATERCFFEQLHVLRLTVAQDCYIKYI